ncbi:LysR family transcriptional regulator [Variovorax sp. GB1P17]|uniref:LysR family transcriptional regulator n=1 Tax=Variovorax sp. GB1P17 TaxID=3443740 RepID=UPI003F450CFC
MDRWFQFELFAEIAALGSLSKAAERLGVSNGAASRSLVDLEERLGVRLVERTTRRLWLTEAGNSFLQRCTHVLEEVRDAEESIRSSAREPIGLLRITSALSFAVNHIAPVLPMLRQKYPKLQVEIVAANRYADFIESGIDVAVRTREVEPDSSITVRPIADTPRVLAASPGYLSRRGVPRHPEELKKHDLLIYTLSRDPRALHFSKGEEKVCVNVESVLDANDGQILLTAARLGHGILVQPLYIILEDIVAGRLVPVLPAWNLPMLTINLAYQSRRHQPAKVQVFAQALIERFERIALNQAWSRLQA